MKKEGKTTLYTLDRALYHSYVYIHVHVYLSFFTRIYTHSQADPELKPINLMETRNVMPPTPLTPPKIVLPGGLGVFSPNPDVMCSTMNAVPTTSSLLNKMKLPLAIHIHPYKDLSMQVHVHVCGHVHVHGNLHMYYMYMYMEIHMCSTLAFRKKKGKVTHAPNHSPDKAKYPVRTSLPT